MVVSAAIEAEVSQLPEEPTAPRFLADLGLDDSGLDRVIRAGYALLGLVTYFTVGPKETRAWTIVKGTKAPQAAGVIHGDFERGFIAAETIAYEDYIACNGEAGASEAGKLRVEGKRIRGQGRRRPAVPVQRLGASPLRPHQGAPPLGTPLGPTAPDPITFNSPVSCVQKLS